MADPNVCRWFIVESFCNTTDEWSAMITALGVLVALGVPIWQHHRERDSRRWRAAESFGKTRQLYEALSGCCDVLIPIEGQQRKRATLSREFRSLKLNIEWLRKLTAADFPDALALRTHLMLAAEFGYAEALAEESISVQLHTLDGKRDAVAITNKLRLVQGLAETLAGYFAEYEREMTNSFFSRIHRACKSRLAARNRKKLPQPSVNIE